MPNWWLPHVGTKETFSRWTCRPKEVDWPWLFTFLAKTCQLRSIRINWIALVVLLLIREWISLGCSTTQMIVGVLVWERQPKEKRLCRWFGQWSTNGFDIIAAATTSTTILLVLVVSLSKTSVAMEHPTWQSYRNNHGSGKLWPTLQHIQ